jgi:predicted transcriptional regulator
MSKESITFRLDTDKREILDQIATGLERDRSYVLNAAIDLYLEVHQWQIAEIQQALVEAEAEDFATPAEVNAVFAKLTQGKRLSHATGD